METLFRFALTRPAVERTEEKSRVTLAQKTAYQTALEKASTSKTARKDLKTAASKYAASKEFVRDLSGLALGSKLEDFGNQLDVLENNQAYNRAALDAVIQKTFASTPKNPLTP